MDVSQLLNSQQAIAQKLVGLSQVPGTVPVVSPLEPVEPKIPEKIEKILKQTPNQMGRGRGIK